MNSHQAERIRAYGEVPETREGQLLLIQEMGYRTLRGGGVLERCPDDQIAAVAHRLYEKAREMQPFRLRSGFVARAEREWNDHLYAIFNIPTEQRDDVSPAELEERLLE